MLKAQLIIVITFLIFSTASFASKSYQIIITNGVQVNDYNFEFDVLIKCNEGNFELTSYQSVLNFNNNIINGGELSFLYIKSTSQLTTPPLVSAGVYSNGETSFLTFASFVGSYNIGENEIRVGRFLLKNTKPFSGIKANVTWNFSGNVTTILTSNNFIDITNPDHHLSTLGNIIDSIGSTSKKIENDSTTNETEELDSYILLQNYPNPFNPTTTIKFKIPQASFVKIKILNVLGEEVRILFNESVNPGIFEVKFDAGSLPSGHYIYSLYADNKIISYKKMILLK